MPDGLWSCHLIGDVLQKAVPVSESFGSQADPLTGGRARKAHVVFLRTNVEKKKKKESRKELRKC